jgi:hypothetical protein
VRAEEIERAEAPRFQVSAAKNERVEAPSFSVLCCVYGERGDTSLPQRET